MRFLNQRKAVTLLVLLGSLTACEITGKGDPENSPCGKFCEDPQPYCNTDLKQCVSCLSSTEHCLAAEASFCSDAGSCTGCTQDTDCAHIENKGVCDTTTNTCIACDSNDDCTDPQSPLCLVSSGTCVQCFVGQDDEHCTDGDKVYSCNPATNTCTQTETESVENCMACQADSECKTNHKCVPMDYDGSAYGNYCLQIENGDCSNPFRTVVDKVSVSSAEDSEPNSYCGVNESLTTCEAVLAWGDPCTMESICVVNGEEALGSFCRKVAGADNSCAYPCEDDVECNSTRVCKDPGDGSPKYCDAT
ncbi:MAG: hypothetical protein IPJ88_11925 [Myxococcales bacterium]|nr:MAG: hypothetical protein IPJ88_11925 [Myxococcales bacterium]